MSSINSRRVISVYSIIVLFAFVFVFTQNSGVSAQKKNQSGSPLRTESHVEGLENYDFRNDKTNAAMQKRASFRTGAGLSASSVADLRDDFVQGEAALRGSVPNLEIEYNSDLRIPEVIAPDVRKGAYNLTGPASGKRVDILRSFAKQNSSLLGVEPGQIDRLKVLTDYTNPNGVLSFTHLKQEIEGIPVFRGEIKAGFTKNGGIVRIINNLAPGLDYDNLSADFGDPFDAVRSAADNIKYKLQGPDTAINNAASTDLRTVFGEGDWATTAEKMYFPIEPGVARPAWMVLIWQPVNAFYVLVDAETGTVFWRKNITEDQTQTSTYNVYANPLGYINVAESPFPGTPGPNDPGLGTQGVGVARTNQVLIGNEGPLNFNNNGWISDGGDRTDGNTVQAGLDIDGVNGVDLNGEAIEVTPGGRDFVFSYNPYDPNTGTGDNPTGSTFRNGAVTQLFYINNHYHDALYQLGFTEPALNFQQNNFGRGGAQNDRISAEAQDSSGTNNANFSTPSDGGRGRMQMYRWTFTTPNIDGDLDADVIIHEFSHGLSNRLHGNAFGLSTNMSRMMGEGWGDFFAHALLSQQSDGINGVYSMGGYDTRNLLSGGLGTANYYYGIRRFPKAIMSFTGGALNRPHNPITFADVDQTTVNYSDGAFAAPVAGHLSNNADQVHSGGEVWSSALWEVRAQMINRLGFAAGNQRAMQVVVDGMKLAPLGPTYIQERDAILAAAATGSPDDIRDVWEGFRIRGMGFSATVDVAGSGGGSARVTEAFDGPNVVLGPGFVVSDVPGNGDGFPEPGEPLLITVPIVNNTGATVTGVTVNLNGGPNVSYGDIAAGNTVSNQIAYTVPGGALCATADTVNINISGSEGPRTEIRRIILGQPDPAATENFDGVTAPALPAGWTTAQTGPGAAFVTATGFPDTSPNSAFTPNQGLPGGNSGSTLDSPEYVINTNGGVVSFRNNYDTEAAWDGGVLEISINGGAYQDILLAGGNFIEGGYNGALGTNSNPLDGRLAWTGNSGGYIDSSIELPPSAVSQPLKFRWRFGEDTNTLSTGWHVDTFVTNYTCSFTP
ncbi:MAG: extracellular metalloproteinase, partial [Acidobacteriota bacterium]|nr:extracellular metalloproteinase [Acidobacteriota bacterium]